MDTFWGLSGTAWTAIYTILTALLLITAWVAAGIAWGQWKAGRDAVQEARKAQIEASRPYVLVTAEPAAANRRLFDLSIRNIGKRPALDIRVRIDPPPGRAKEIDKYEFAKMKMLNEPIVMLAPDQDMRAYWDSHLDRPGVNLPTSHQVHLTYKDSSGVTYEETSVIDLDAMQGSIFPAEVKTLHDVGESLDEIRKTLRDASILSRPGSAEVLAVTETREANEHRQAQRRYHQLLSTLRSAKTWDRSDPKQIAELEAELARMEEMHSDLKEDGSMPAASDEERPSGGSRSTGGRLRLTMGQRLRALFGCPSPRGVVLTPDKE